MAKDASSVRKGNMNVALDIDDTITRCPDFFAFLSKALKDAGHHVYVISYRMDRESTAKELKDLGIVYHELLLADERTLDEVGFYRWKVETCRKLGINVLFEDMPEVVNGLDEATVAFVPFDPNLGRMTYVANAQNGAHIGDRSITRIPMWSQCERS